MSSDAPLDAEVIEESKENVQPLRRGRTTSGLRQALKVAETPRMKSKLDDEREVFEQQIEQYRGEDPLSVWLKYIKWTQEHHPTSGQSAHFVQLLERCTREFADAPQYANDARYLRVWITYADACSDPTDIFEFLRSKGIGQDLALFYEAYALVLENKRNYGRADGVYEEGIHRGAQPLDRLRNRHKQFCARMMQRVDRVAEEGDDSGATEDENGESATSRGALRGISHAAAQGAVSRVGPVVDSQRGLRGSRSAKPGENAAPGANGFAIYEDADLQRGAAGPDSVPWTQLATQKELRKENTAAPAPWINNGLSNGAAAAPGAVKESGFAIYVDDDLRHAGASAPDHGLDHDRRQQLQQHITSTEEQLRSEPLRNFSGAPASTSARGKRQERAGYRKDLLVGPRGEEMCFAEQHLRHLPPPVLDESRDSDMNEMDLDDGEDYTVVAGQFVGNGGDAGMGAKEARRAPLGALAAPETTGGGAGGAGAGGGIAAGGVRSVDTSQLAADVSRKLSFGSPGVHEPSECPGTVTRRLQFGTPTPPRSVDDMSRRADSFGGIAAPSPTMNTKAAIADVMSMFSEDQTFSRRVSAAPRRESVAAGKGAENNAAARPPVAARKMTNRDIIAQELGGSDTTENVQPAAPREETANETAAPAFEIFCDPEFGGDGDGDDENEQRSSNSNSSGNSGNISAAAAALSVSKAERVHAEPHDGNTSLTYSSSPSPVSSSRAREHDAVSGAELLDPYTEPAIAHRNEKALGALTGAREVNVFAEKKCPSIAALHVGADGKPPSNNVLKLGENSAFVVQGVLGKGAFATVYTVLRVDAANPDDTSGITTLALKAQRPPCPAEYAILTAIHARVRADVSSKFLFPKGFTMFQDRSFILSQHLGYGSLQDVINMYLKSGKCMDEVVVMHYTMEILDTLEALHGAHIIHGDIKPDNFLLRGSDDSSLVLIDFGRSLDLKNYRQGVEFTGDCHVKNFQCVEMLTGAPWTHQIDTFGLLGTVHCMLYGQYMDVTDSPRSSKDADAPKRWRIKQPWKRYWQADLWEGLFDTLLNIESCDAQPKISDLRKPFADYLATHSDKKKALKRLLTKQSILMYEYRKSQ